MYIESPIIIVDYNHNIFIVLATVATNENLDCNMFITKATRIRQSITLIGESGERPD
jgi:hypothetical protein